MTQPTFEVANILRVQGDRFLNRYRSSFGFQQLKAFRAILRCRTAALGGQRDACPSCGHQAISYNSCRNRHCPKCQTQARQRWLAARERELLTTSYFHVVFTVPHEAACTSDNSRTGSFGFWRMTATGWVGAMLYRGLQSGSSETQSKYSSTTCFLRDSR